MKTSIKKQEEVRRKKEVNFRSMEIRIPGDQKLTSISVSEAAIKPNTAGVEPAYNRLPGKK